MPASPVHHTSIDKTSPWDGGAAEKAFDKKASDFKLFYAWYDQGEVDPDADGSDKEDGWGPHHDVNGAGVPGAANLSGVHAAVAALNGAHGTKSRIPDSDRQGVYNHLVAHLKDAGVDKNDIPELKHADLLRKGRSRRELGVPGRETRFFTARDLEIRSSETSSSGMVEVRGTVIVYGVPYQVNDMWGSFTETIHFGAATQVLESQDLDVRFLFNHDDMPMARTASPKCPVTLTEDQSGVHVTAFLDPRMNVANDLILAMDPDHRLVTQMSVGMQVDPDGDLWSGEDEYGLPNVRNIVKLANIFDTSAVTYPASTTTNVELGRAQHVYEAARSVRAGRGTTAQAEAVMRMLDRMNEALRAAPTDADDDVAEALANAHQWLATAKAAQAKDPDTNSDPDDKKVASGIDEALTTVGSLMDAQAKDGNPDKEKPEEKDADGDDDDDYQGDPDGTTSGESGDAPVPDNEDGTGTRDAKLAELAELRANLRARQRRLAVERARLRL